VKSKLARLKERSPWLAVAIDVQKRFGELQGGMIASAVTLALFLSLFPLLLVGTAVVGFLASGRTDLAGDLIDKLGLSGEAATTFRDAVSAAEASRRTASVVGFVGLLWASLGVVAAMQMAINRAWQARGRGWKDKPIALLWLVGAFVVVGASFTLTGLAVEVLPGWAWPFGHLATVAMNVVLFWWSFYVLGSVKIGWRPLLPGALFAGIGFQVLTTVGAWYVPRAVASSSALYGSIGVVFAILAWLFFFGRLVVYASTLNVILHERRAGTVTVELDAPRIPGEVPVEADRSGIVVESPH
jgi:membrane protein